MAFSLKKLLQVCLVVACGVALLSTPLLLRFSVYSERTLPMGYQDVIPLHQHSSTFWCENMTTTSPHTFNAYLFDSAEPNFTEHSMQNRRVHVRVASYYYLGMYFLRGSRISITCCPAGRGTKLHLIAGLGKLEQCLHTVTGRNDSSPNSSFPVPPVQGPILDSQIRRNSTAWSVQCTSEASVDLVPDACGSGGPLRPVLWHEAQADGYLYLLFLNDPASEAYNDVQLGVDAWRRVFDRNKTLDACREALKCSLPLAFLSRQFVVAERSRSTPTRTEPAFLHARCEPRRKVYFLFYLAFALLFMVAAFQ
ncbi:hypothetical protein HPB51_009794 [Rhipicephalus microplus]|uniref:E3 ubiquitin-protein ligase APD1-4 middle domain-containing protein n=1 Tax=Rhipicephalus microplus TaxID=6941 RepID=A0A9J6F0E6_RHIMP|nr:hypothetical protein HPB51_009794 [Rhipicephalus microplus]